MGIASWAVSDFENEIAQIEGRINELRHISSGKSVSILKEITDLDWYIFY